MPERLLTEEDFKEDDSDTPDIDLEIREKMAYFGVDHGRLI